MKLIKITANGFTLCENDFTLSFIPDANKTFDDKEFELHEIDENLFVFKTVGIIGKNASGKTTTLNLLSIIYDIFSNFRVKNSSKLFKYIDELIELDIVFYHENTIYRYQTELKKDDTSLNQIINFDNQKLFKRVYKKKHSANLFEFDKYTEVKYDVKLLDDTSILVNLLEKVDTRAICCPFDHNEYKDYSSAFKVYKLLDNDYKIIESIIKIFDEHIENIEMLEENKFKIIYKNKEDKDVSASELFDILSSGTTKGIGLYVYVVYALQKGADLIIDEIENHFHKTLVETLLNLFKDKSVNKKNSSLIFTTHYCELLDLFNRRDNIYITKYEENIRLENMHKSYNFRPELSKSKKFYENAFNTDVNYEALMDFKRNLM